MTTYDSLTAARNTAALGLTECEAVGGDGLYGYYFTSPASRCPLDVLRQSGFDVLVVGSIDPTGVPATTLPGNGPTSSRPAPSSCGLSEAAVLTEALSQLPLESNTGRGWATEPVASNFDACADLSTILVTVEGATGSSPVQALMFHRGEYLGTGTSEAYGFTDLDTEASTPDTVVLTYKTGQTCNACDDGVTTSVRYQWDGQAVQMLDSLPSL